MEIQVKHGDYNKSLFEEKLIQDPASQALQWTSELVWWDDQGVEHITPLKANDSVIQVPAGAIKFRLRMTGADESQNGNVTSQSSVESADSQAINQIK
jgi:hypothetical protein